MAVRSTVTRTGEPLTGVCSIIVGAGLEGCDENGDGQVEYRGVAPGTRVVTETRAPAGYAPVPDFTIVVPETRGHEVVVAHEPASERIDVAVVTLDAATGERLAGSCFIIENASIEGRDEHGDGQVDFADVHPGSYEFVQTAAPAGYVPSASRRVTIAEPLFGDVLLIYVRLQRR